MPDQRYRTWITIHSIIGTSCFAILVQLMGNSLVDDVADINPFALPLLAWSMVASGMVVIIRLIYPPEIRLAAESLVPFLTVTPALIGGASLLYAMEPLAGITFGAAFVLGFLYAERNEATARRQRRTQPATTDET